MSRRQIDLTVHWDAPQPLGYHQAVDRALELRARGNIWTWTVIADTMGMYHGFHRGPWWWKRQLCARGAEARPRGVPFRSVA
jgi:hypothetical protein